MSQLRSPTTSQSRRSEPPLKTTPGRLISTITMPGKHGEARVLKVVRHGSRLDLRLWFESPWDNETRPTHKGVNISI